MPNNAVVSISTKKQLEKVEDYLKKYFVEIRIDKLGLSIEELEKILMNEGDFIITFRGSIHDWKERQTFYDLAHTQNQFIDLDINTDREFVKPFVAYDKLIFSYHDFKNTPTQEEIVKILQIQKKFKPKYLKFASKVRNYEDLLNLESVSNKFDNLIMTPMGKNVEFARIKFWENNSKFMYFSPDNKAIIDGQIPIQQFEFLTSNKTISLESYGVFGAPIAHSLSPSLFQQLNLVKTNYTRFYSEKSQDQDLILKRYDLDGFNVTSPLKKINLRKFRSDENHTKEIENSNTCKRHADTYLSINTDFRAVQDILDGKVKLESKVLIIGAGDAAEACIYPIGLITDNITIINRTAEKSKTLANKFKINHDSFDNLKELTEKSDIIINTIPIELSDIKEIQLKSQQLILDAIYKESNWQKLSNKFDCTFISGINWLIKQAEYGFNFILDRDDIKLKVPEPSSNKNVILIGFMGSGKTTIGTYLAKRLEKEFIDLDNYIQRKEARSVSNIIKEDSEEKFREIEQKYMQEILFNNTNCIIATGGGFCNNLVNKLLLKDNFTILLHSELDECLERVGADETRPILEKSPEEIEYIYDQRKFRYFYFSDYVIYNQDKDKTLNILQNEISSSKIL